MLRTIKIYESNNTLQSCPNLTVLDSTITLITWDCAAESETPDCTACTRCKSRLRPRRNCRSSASSASSVSRTPAAPDRPCESACLPFCASSRRSSLVF